MKTNLVKLASLLILCFFARIYLIAQTKVSVYTDEGQNNVSEGLFIKTAGLANYQFGKYNAEAGIQLDLKSNNNVLPGYAFKFSKEFLIKRFSLEMLSFYLLTPYSDVLRETNWGFLVNIKRKHFVIGTGVNFRTYALTKTKLRNPDYNTNTKIHEVGNIMYSFSYYLKPYDNRWNIFLSVKDFDNFNISQETNPVLNLGFTHKLSSPLRLFVESFYKSAGVLNMSVNYFGFYIRTGIIWNIF
jgi:hypothetical protein